MLHPPLSNFLDPPLRTPVLLQTAQLRLFDPHFKEHRTVTRAILDGGSQRMYITSRLRDELSLPIVRMELLQIETFGRTDCDHTSCDVVQMGVETKHDVGEMMHALVGPFICNPLAVQPIDHSSKPHNHLFVWNWPTLLIPQMCWR